MPCCVTEGGFDFVAEHWTWVPNFVLEELARASLAEEGEALGEGEHQEQQPDSRLDGPRPAEVIETA